MRCDWVHYPEFSPRRWRKGREERCPEEACWVQGMANGPWYLCDHHKTRYIESMNAPAAKKESALWKPIE